ILKLDWVEESMNNTKEIVTFFRSHYRAEAILQQEPNTIMLVKPVDTHWETYLDSVQSIIYCKIAIQTSVLQPTISNIIGYNLKTKILGEELWNKLELLKLLHFIKLFESDTPLLSYVYAEWNNLYLSVEELNLDLYHEEEIFNLITTRFKFIFHPALALANLLDPKKALKPDDLTEVIILYLNESYSSATAVH
ncbi:2022_t:CDS:2, partial [Ambispora leptoticha]